MKKEILSEIFKQWSGKLPDEISTLPQSGSNRQYFRLSNETQTAIGVYNEDKTENRAFIEFSKHFFKKGLKVPQIYSVHDSNEMYLQEDLGNSNLYSLLDHFRPSSDSPFPDELKQLYKTTILQLISLQVKGSEGLNYELCYPVSKFDKQSILWDLNYFKYYFLKLTGTAFHEAKLEIDFHNFADDLLEIPSSFFMHRDFQSRNIMINKDEIFFIDYQGGRMGPLQYDLASLLYQAKAAIPQKTRDELLEFYFTELQTALPKLEFKKFRSNFYSIVLVRTLQVLGAYGFRGIFERKEHFIKSIPFALDNLEFLLKQGALSDNHTQLKSACEAILKIDKYRHQQKDKTMEKLLIRIHSFSYKRGIPEDKSGNGGGFVFDCRGLLNPGRYEPYKKQTGRDQPVKDFLIEKSKIEKFLKPVFTLVESSVETYIERGFKNLSVNFGCTGGQHRSVYSADQMAKHLTEKYDVEVEVNHIEQELKNWVN